MYDNTKCLICQAVAGFGIRSRGILTRLQKYTGVSSGAVGSGFSISAKASIFGSGPRLSTYGMVSDISQRRGREPGRSRFRAAHRANRMRVGDALLGK
jgi:hypothetical protein